VATIIDNRRLFKSWFFFRSLRPPLVSVTWFKTSDHVLTISWSCDKWISALGKVASQFVCKFVEQFLARCNSRYVTEKSLTDAKSIAWIRFCLDLGIFEEFAAAVLQTMAICAKTYLSARDHFFWIMWMKPTVRETAYCIFCGLDWTGLVKRGLVKRGLVKRGLGKTN